MDASRVGYVLITLLLSGCTLGDDAPSSGSPTSTTPGATTTPPPSDHGAAECGRFHVSASSEGENVTVRVAFSNCGGSTIHLSRASRCASDQPFLVQLTRGDERWYVADEGAAIAAGSQSCTTIARSYPVAPGDNLTATHAWNGTFMHVEGDHRVFGPAPAGDYRVVATTRSAGGTEWSANATWTQA